TFDLRNLDGSSAAPPVLRTIPASGQIAIFLRELFPALPNSFRGLLRITTVVTPIAVDVFRAQTNERGNFLITATQVSDETKTASPADSIIPQIVDGGGYTTQFILFSAITTQSPSGVVRFFGPNGLSLNLATR